MKLSEYAELDATELAALVRGGAVSPRELVETALTAIQQTDKEIHAVVDYTYDYAMEQIKKGIDKNAPFCGVPFVLKTAVVSRPGSAPHWVLASLAAVFTPSATQFCSSA